MAPLAPILLQASGQPAADIMPWIPLLGIVAVFWFLLIRPQQKQAQKQKQMIAALRKGDQVITQAGLFGKVFSISDKEVVLEIAAGTKVRWLKSQIAGVEKPAEEGGADAGKKE